MTKMPAHNERFGATAAESADLKDSAGMPPLRHLLALCAAHVCFARSVRQAAIPLSVILTDSSCGLGNNLTK